MARTGRKNKSKKDSQHNNKKNNDTRIIVLIEVALFLLYIGVYAFYMDRISEIISGAKFSIGVLVSVCSITGFNISNINQFMRKHSKRKGWLKCILRFKHHGIILFLIIINTWMISSITALAPDAGTGDSEKLEEHNTIQIAETETNQNIDVSDGDYPDLYPENMLSPHNNEMDLIPSSIKELYSYIIEEDQIGHQDSLSVMQLLSRENKEPIKNMINTCLQKKYGTGYQPTNEIVNANVEFTNYTREANRLSEALAEMGMDESALLDIIELRTKAYEIIQTKSLRKLLANNWERLGLYYYKVNKPAEDTYGAILKSIEYRTEYLRMLNYDDTELYWEVYRIGRAFSTVSLVSGLDNNYKLHASLIACCILELASSNSNAEDSEKILFYSSYYAGMENHKLLLSIPTLGDEAIKEVSGIYISDGLKYYKRSLEASNYKKQRFMQHEYIKQVVDIGLNYTGTHKIKNCNSKQELMEIKIRYQ
ncbi:hypothetical protein MASR2M70_03350 [Bacillota bacterium]